jgi:hypothetical protein
MKRKPSMPQEVSTICKHMTRVAYYPHALPSALPFQGYRTFWNCNAGNSYVKGGMRFNLAKTTELSTSQPVATTTSQARSCSNTRWAAMSQTKTTRPSMESRSPQTADPTTILTSSTPIPVWNRRSLLELQRTSGKLPRFARVVQSEWSFLHDITCAAFKETEWWLTSQLSWSKRRTAN